MNWRFALWKVRHPRWWCARRHTHEWVIDHGRVGQTYDRNHSVTCGVCGHIWMRNRPVESGDSA